MGFLLLNGLEVRAPVWNSAFKIPEKPMSFMNKLLNTHGRWYDIIDSSPVTEKDLDNDLVQLWLDLKKFKFTEMKLGAARFGGKLQSLAGHLYDKKITILATAGQVIAYPISCAFTPITAIADIFAGVIQATIRTYQGASKEEIQSILHKKVIAAPAQQLAYTINNFIILGPLFREIAKITAIATICLVVVGVGLCLFTGIPLAGGMTIAAAIPEIFASVAMDIAPYGILFYSILMGDRMYRDAQGMVGKLPKFLIPDGYNIFIEGGALNEFGDKAFDPEGEYAEFKQQAKDSRRKSSEENSYSPNFKDSIKKYLDDVREKDPSFKGLRDWFTSNKKPYTLFGFESADKVNESDLKESYKRWALKCHPDRCLEKSKKEAEILFTMLKTARDDVEETILNKRSK